MVTVPSSASTAVTTRPRTARVYRRRAHPGSIASTARHNRPRSWAVVNFGAIGSSRAQITAACSGVTP